MEIRDEDILDAMQHISGYLDISTVDFRAIYELAHRHALDRFFGSITAERLMRQPIPALDPEDTLEGAVKQLEQSGYKGLPVTNSRGLVIGMLTETDLLRELHASGLPGLLLKMMANSFELAHGCHDIRIRDAMTRSPVSVDADARFREIVDAFSRHGGRSMPVVTRDGKLRGLLLRKDFLLAYKDGVGQ